jgi:hypothetical protein
MQFGSGQQAEGCLMLTLLPFSTLPGYHIRHMFACCNGGVPRRVCGPEMVRHSALHWVGRATPDHRLAGRDQMSDIAPEWRPRTSRQSANTSIRCIYAAKRSVLPKQFLVRGGEVLLNEVVGKQDGRATEFATERMLCSGLG